MELGRCQAGHTFQVQQGVSNTNVFPLEKRTRTDREGAGAANEDEADLKEVHVDQTDVVIKRIGVINSTWEQ